MQESQKTLPSDRTGPKDEAYTLPILTRLKFSFVRGFYILLAWCFSLSGLYYFSRFWGWCEWAINYKRRRKFKAYIRSLLGDSISERELSKATREHICRVRCDKTFYTILDKLPRQKIINRIHWTGREYLDQSVARGKGTYILFSHHGSHHVGGLLLALQGYKKLAAVRDPDESPLRQFVQDCFAQSFPEFRDEVQIFMAGEFPRELFRHFQNNGILGTGLDVSRQRSETSRTITVQLFGQPQTWLTGTVNIALRCGATIIPGFFLSEPRFHFRYLFYPPLCDPDASQDDPETVQTVMKAYAAGIERHVWKYPEHVSKAR